MALIKTRQFVPYTANNKRTHYTLGPLPLPDELKSKEPDYEKAEILYFSHPFALVASTIVEFAPHDSGRGCHVQVLRGSDIYYRHVDMTFEELEAAMAEADEKSRSIILDVRRT